MVNFFCKLFISDIDETSFGHSVLNYECEKFMGLLSNKLEEKSPQKETPSLCSVRATF